MKFRAFIFFLGVLLASAQFLAIPYVAEATSPSSLLKISTFVKGTVTDQGDCTNISGKLMAVYRSSTSEGIPFVFEDKKTRVIPEWVAPRDGQNVFVILGPKVTCTKADGSSRQERRAIYYRVTGAKEALDKAKQDVSKGVSKSTQAVSRFEKMYPLNQKGQNLFPLLMQGIQIRSVQSGQSVGGSNIFGQQQTILTDTPDVSGSEYTREIAR